MVVDDPLIGAFIDYLHFTVVHVARQRIRIADRGELPQTADSDLRVHCIQVVVCIGVAVEFRWFFASLRRVSQEIAAVRVILVAILEL